ncbi:MAG: DNA repair protein RecO, partial [Gemmatimonadota bacterium]
GETSRIVRLATRDHGVQSAIAKGASRPRSRFGAGLQVLSAGQAHLLLSERHDLHTLTAFDLTNLPVRLTADVGRYATATAAAEVVLRVAPAEPHPEAYDVLLEALQQLEVVPLAELPAVSIRALWRLVGALGFAPALDACARDGRPLPESGDVAFSAPDGGALCTLCARESETTMLPAAAREALGQLSSGVGGLPDLDARHAAAHRRLVARYIRFHMAEGAALPALEFWLGQGWVAA